MPRENAIGSVLDRLPEELTEVPSNLGEPPPPLQGPPLPEEPHPSSPGPEARPPVSNARLGMLVFLAFEAMLFAGLIGAFLVYRLGSQVWPPLGQPRLPLLVTWANTATLLLSGYTMRAALRAIRVGDREGVTTGLSRTALLGTIFLVVQGSEWVRLIRHGLTLSAGIYGATFYTVIGCHGVHVLGAVIWMLIARCGSSGDQLLARRHVGVELCGMYWYFVVGLWPVLFTLVYLS